MLKIYLLPLTNQLMLKLKDLNIENGVVEVKVLS